MRFIRPMIVIAFGILAIVAPSAPATAGGPTSALLVAPGSNAVGLYVDDQEYAELVELVDAYDTDVSGDPDDDPRKHAQGPFVTVTWMIHDTQAWRVDRIYYEADGGPWVHTVDNVRASSRERWHRSSDSGELRDLLDRLHLTDGEYVEPPSPAELAGPPLLAGPGELAKPSVSQSGEVREQEAAAPSRGAAVDEAGWWWVGGGVAAGVLVGAGAIGLYPRTRRVRPKHQRPVDS
ncbi:MAG TPA: hypothetical protein VK059_08060 [Nocardioidaceae bacterium]|nr:hypothetical protein [Nocardioidaceae bacterium]